MLHRVGVELVADTGVDGQAPGDAPVVLDVGSETEVTEIAVPVRFTVACTGEEARAAGQQVGQSAEGVVPIPIGVAEAVDLLPPYARTDFQCMVALGPGHVVGI